MKASAARSRASPPLRQATYAMAATTTACTSALATSVPHAAVPVIPDTGASR